MAKKKVKLKEQKMVLAAHQPTIKIVDGIPQTSAEELRVQFVSAALSSLVLLHGDLGGRDDKRIAKEAIRLGDMMVDAYLNT
jgi:hypothetical protein